MRSLRALAAVVIVLGCVGAAVSARGVLWQKVREATGKGLPRTALESLPAIIETAERDHAWAEAVRAVMLRIALEARIQGNKPEEKITRLQAELSRVPAPMRPTMEAVLAEWYWQYFQDNRWRFMQRSQTATAPGDDFTAWDLKRIYAEIDLHFSRALADSATLRHTPIGDWEDLLTGGNSPDGYRPTLYDFVAFEALRFYQSGEQAGARPEDAFVLSADGPVLDDADEFLRWQVAATDSASPALKAVRLYQRQLAWHAADRDPSAFVDADLWRLEFARNTAVGAGKNERSKRAYRRLAERYAGIELSSRALHAWAAVLYDDGRLVEAHEVATRGVERFPGSIGSNRCFNLLQELETRTLQVSTESVWNDARPVLNVRYRNLSAVHFRLVPWDFARGLQQKLDPTNITSSDLTAALAAAPVRAWADSLAGTPDYKEAEQHLQAPTGIPPGPYVLLYSGKADFSEAQNVVGAQVVWVSDLALVVRSRPGVLDGLVLDARSGEPIPYAHMRLWSFLRTPNLHEEPAVLSDSTGHFQWPAHERAQVVMATLGTRQLGQVLTVGAQDPRTYWAHQQTVLFTDRAIYRPGQPIHFKGICIDVDQEHDRYHTIAAQSLTLELRDPNGKTVERTECRSNDYGSFSGEFQAPRDRLLGAMSLQVLPGPPGSTSIRVEEYKRPRFYAELDAPRTPARLDSSVTVTGHATAYTGAAVDGAKVSWRVTRGVRYPAWWAWRFGWWATPLSSTQEVAHGESTVGADGRFDVRFVARPDPAVDAEQEPSFAFAIQADVTEPSGETRSASRQVVVGYTVLAAGISAAEWQVADRPVDLDVSTSTLDGVPQPARGTLTIHRLLEPRQVRRAPLGANRYDGWRSRGALARVNAEPDAADPTTWASGEVVATLPVETDTLGHRIVSVPLRAGMYRATLETRDRYGRKVTAVRPLQVLDLSSVHLGVKLADLFKAQSGSVEVGQDFLAVWGTGYERGRAYVEIEHRGRILSAWWTPVGATQTVIRQHVNEAMRGGFTVRVTRVRENRAYLHQVNVDVPWSDRRLDLHWEHFVSHLRPGQHETWTAVVTGPHAVRQAAEMVATLYDASLDAYASLWWPQTFGVFRTEYSSAQSQFSSALMEVYPRLGGWSRDYRDDALDYRQFPYGLLTGSYDASLVPDRLAMRRPRAGRHEAGRSNGVSVYAERRLVDMKSSSTLRALPVGALTDNLPQAIAAKAGIVAQGDELHFRGGRAEEQKLDVNGLAASGAGAASARDVNLDRVAARHNLQETAFFFPHLLANDRGEVRMEFTMPEAVTRWCFLGFAHDRDLRSGVLAGEAVTTQATSWCSPTRRGSCARATCSSSP